LNRFQVLRNEAGLFGSLWLEHKGDFALNDPSKQNIMYIPKSSFRAFIQAYLIAISSSTILRPKTKEEHFALCKCLKEVTPEEDGGELPSVPRSAPAGGVNPRGDPTFWLLLLRKSKLLRELRRRWRKGKLKKDEWSLEVLLLRSKNSSKKILHPERI